MALQLRRGLDGSARTAITPGVGELIYTTDTKKVYVGDGTTAGGNAVSPVVSVNTLTGAVVLTADNIAESGSPTNKYFTDERAQDAAAAMLVAGTHTGITFTYGSTQDGANRIDATVAASTSVINTGTTNALAIYAANGTTLSPSSSLLWSESLNLLQNFNGAIQVTANNFGRGVLISDSYHTSTTLSNNIILARGRGTNITPTTVLAGDPLGAYSFQAHDGTSLVTNAAVAGVATAGATVSTGIVPSTLSFQTMAQSGAFESRMRLSENGLTLGPSASTDTGTGRITANQTTTSSPSTLRGRNFFNDANGAEVGLYKYRGTYAVTAPVQTGDVLGQVVGNGNTTASTLGSGTTAAGGSIQFVADGTVSSGVIPGALNLRVSNQSGVLSTVVKINNTTTGSTNALVAITGNLSFTGLEIISPNYITVSSSGTFVLSTSTWTNILLVTTTALTATLTFPSSPVDGQIVRFAVHTNTVTLALTAGPTLSGLFAGSVTAPTTFTYVYRATGTTWYRIQ